MGESIMEATILNWAKNVGDSVEEDETILEIATDKVDSEVPSPTSGIISEILYQENDVVEIGKVIAIITTEGEEAVPKDSPATGENKQSEHSSNANGQAEPVVEKREPVLAGAEQESSDYSQSTRFYSPLVKNIAKEENISLSELENITGTGSQGRVTKHDIMAYLEHRQAPQSTPYQQPVQPTPPKPTTQQAPTAPSVQPTAATSSTMNGGATEIIEMDRMRKLIAEHMVKSVQTSPHVTSFVEADVTNIVNWRNKIKKSFQEKYGEKITFTPIFAEAVVKAIKDFPMINISLEGNNIIQKKFINIGMAAALPSGNLIVPVIKNADHLNLLGLTKAVNDLARRARENKLKAEEIQDGTYTITNVGTFGNVMGTPIINQPQVAILATGAIQKKPAVVETEHGDLIAVRHKMFLSHSYDHRVVDGALGGSFVRRVADYLEQFDINRAI